MTPAKEYHRRRPARSSHEGRQEPLSQPLKIRWVRAAGASFCAGTQPASQPNWTDAEVAKITTPTAIVLGDHDEAITRSHTDHMAEVIPGSEEIILPAVSHFAMLQAPDEYTATVRAFIDR